ncbi:MAG TPA: hypothetical protein VH165_32520 [Kofleriaceae bacterium]|jgi:hypothetical protein|nr:hypothetical protein [Kofleriaceae bacterium]
MKLMLAVVAWSGIGVMGAGCGTDTAAPGSGDPGTAGDDDGSGTGSGSDPGTGPGMTPGTGPVTEVSGEIKADTTWMDTIHVTGKITIDKGVTVTVAPGTVVNIDETIGMLVNGTLAIQGVKAQKVTFQPSAADTFWSDIVVGAGGAITASYLVQTGGSYYISATGKATFTDSQMSHAGGDLMTMSGGTLNMSYSQIGLELNQKDGTHCDMHVEGSPTITVTHSTISTSSYGIMYYGGVNANFTYDNWFGNTYDVEILPAYPVVGDFSYGYFAKGAPTGSGVTATHMSATRVTDAGVR